MASLVWASEAARMASSKPGVGGADDDVLARGLAHVVHSQRRDAGCRQGFHLDTGGGAGARHGLDEHAVADDSRMDLDNVEVITLGRPHG